MLKNTILLICVLLSAMSFLAQAASFDCTKAITLIEKAICSHPELSHLDELLMSSYSTALVNAPNPETVKTRQRAWLQFERARCQTVGCLQEQYTRRITELQEWGAAVPALAAVSGTYERMARGKPDTHTATLTIRSYQDGHVHVSGDAQWIGNAKTGSINVGNVDGTFLLRGNTVYYTDADNEDGCTFTIAFSPNALRVTNDNLRCGGLNVTFNGQYRRLRASKTQ